MRRNWVSHKLALPAVTVWRNDHAACNGIGDPRPEITPHKMKTGVDPRRTARRCDDVALVDIKDIVFSADIWELRFQIGEVGPVGGGASSIKQTRMGEDEGTIADRHEDGSTRGGAAKFGQQALWRAFAVGPPGGYQDDPGLPQFGHPRSCRDAHAAEGTDTPTFGGYDRHLIARVPVVGQSAPKDLERHAQAERSDLVVDDHGNAAGKRAGLRVGFYLQLCVHGHGYDPEMGGLPVAF